MNKIFKNHFLLFSPFLCFYLLFILLFPPDFGGDQSEYLGFARNLINGFYSPPSPNIDLTSGPGYPLIIAPFVALGLPLLWITFLNAVFYYLSIIFLFKALKLVVELNLAFLFSLFWACYYVAYQTLNAILTEPFTFFLISILIFSLIKAFKIDNSKESKIYVYLAGLTIGIIVLTKLIFGYVLMIMIAGNLILLIIDRKGVNYRRGLFILFIGFASVTPYLIYTYNLTGRAIYWGTGNSNLYWMSTPYDDEYGDWKGDLTQGPVSDGNFNIPGSDDTLKSRHGKDFEEIYKFSGIEQDDAFKRIAIDNIKSHPLKYARNIIYGLGRLVFHYPFSYAVQRPKILLVLPINAIVFTLILFCLVPTFINWRKISYAIRFLLLFCFIYLMLSAMVSAYVRMLTIVMPVLFLWFAFILHKSVKIFFRFNDIQNFNESF
jgi:hypothetical protein